MKGTARIGLIGIFLVFAGYATAQPTAPQDTGVAQATHHLAETFSEVLKRRVPKGVPVMDDIAITPPDSSVSRDLAEFSGAWVGEWYGERTNSYMADQLIVFEKISAESITVVSGGIGRFVGGSYTNHGQTWSGRSDMRLENKGLPLVLTTPSGYTLTYKVEGGKMRARSASAGGAWVGTFEKVQ